MERVFIRDVGMYKLGDIADLNWDAFAQSAAQYQGITGGVESFSIPVDEAARRYALERVALPGGRRPGKSA